MPGISEKMFRAISDRLTVGELSVSEPPGNRTGNGTEDEIDEGEEIEVIGEVEEMDVTSVWAESQSESPEPVPPRRALVKLRSSVEPAPEPAPEPEVERTTPPSLRPPPSSSHPPAPRAPRGYVGLTVAAVAGALFGALLALVVIGGINGTLDFGQAEAVVNNQAGLDRLSVRADTLQSDLDGVRQRLDRLEGLTARMDGVERAVDDLDSGLTEIQTGLDALDARADFLEADIATVRAAAERFNTFLDGLRDLMFEYQGAPPTSTPTLPPTATPRPTRTPRPSPTPTGAP